MNESRNKFRAPSVGPDPLSRDVLNGKFIDGNVIQAEVEDGRIVFTK